jgi:transposase
MVTDRVELITSVELRRRWSSAEKARLVAAMNEPGAVVTEIARRGGVDASLLNARTIREPSTTVCCLA